MKDQEIRKKLEKVAGGKTKYHVTIWRCPKCGATRRSSEMVEQESYFCISGARIAVLI